MVFARALLGTTLGTALGLSLAGCAMDMSSNPTSALVASRNHAAAASVAAAAQPGPYSGSQAFTVAPVAPAGGTPVAEVAAEPPVVSKGSVLWRRTGDEADLAPTPKVGEELRRLRNSLREVQGSTSQQFSQLENRLDTNQRSIEQLADEQARQERDLRAQAADAIGNVSAMASESMRSMERVARNNSDRWFATNQQLAQLETRLQTAIADTQSRQLRADERTQSYTDLKVSKAQLENQLAAVREARQAALEAELRAKTFTGQQLASRDQVIGGLIASTDELRKLTQENRALASSEITNVAAALRQYGDAQLQQVAASTSATLASLARATDQSVAGLRAQTDQRLGKLWLAANQRAEKLAEQKANAVAVSLAALREQVTPEQIRAVAEQTVADSTPEFRALALQTMQEGQDYIRTVARTAVQDNDPAMQTALADAARNVITKDDRVVFAIRKAVAEELHSIALDPSATAPAAEGLTEAESVEADRLRIAQLLAPGGGPAPDAAKLANLSPAAGNPPQSAGGQKSWSAPGTSLMPARNRADWMDIRQYKVIVHEDNRTLEELFGKVLKDAEPFTGPWQVRWKISDQNRDVMAEKFSLDAETSFEEFVSYLAQYVVNDRGVKLSFSLFDNERIIVISD